MENEFYMVYVDGEHTPTYKHSTIESAEKEAKRLSKQFNKRAYILGTIKAFELNVFREINCNVEELPF